MQGSQPGILAPAPAPFPGAVALRVLWFTGKYSLFLRTIASPSSAKFPDKVPSKLQSAAGSGSFLTVGSRDIKNDIFKSAYQEHRKEHKGLHRGKIIPIASRRKCVRFKR